MKGGRKWAEFKEETMGKYEKVSSSEIHTSYCYSSNFKDFAVRKVLPSKQGLKQVEACAPLEPVQVRKVLPSKQGLKLS